MPETLKVFQNPPMKMLRQASPNYTDTINYKIIASVVFPQQI